MPRLTELLRSLVKSSKPKANGHRTGRRIQLEQLEPRYALTAPTANHDLIVVEKDTPFSLVMPGILGNDTDPEEGPLFVTEVDGSAANVGVSRHVSDTSGVGGMLTIHEHGGLSFEPDPGYDGAIPFTYRIRDVEFLTNLGTGLIHVVPRAFQSSTGFIQEGQDGILDEFSEEQGLWLHDAGSVGPGLEYYWRIDTGPVDPATLEYDPLVDTRVLVGPDHAVSWAQLNAWGIYDATTTAVITLMVEDDAGTRDYDQSSLEVADVSPGAITFDFEPDPNGDCGELAVVMNATLDDANPLESIVSVSIDWNWDIFNGEMEPTPDEMLTVTTNVDGTFSVIANHIYETAGNQWPVLFITSHNSATANEEEILGSLFYDNPLLVSPLVTVSPTGAALSYSSPDDYYAYDWSVTKDGNPFDPGTPADQHDFAFTPTESGAYLLTFTGTRQIIIPNDPEPPFIIYSDEIFTHNIVVTGGAGTFTAEIVNDTASPIEGSAVDLHAAISGGCGPAPAFTWSINSGVHTGAGNSFSFSPIDNGTYTVELFDGATLVDTLQFNVGNVAPTLAISGASSINEGATYTLNLSSFDPGADTITSWTIDWGDGTEIVNGNPISATHTYPDGDANFVISASASDEDGTFTAGNTVAITVNNVAPTLGISGAANVNEGATYTLNLSSFDPGADTITQWTINWGDGTQIVSGNPVSVNHTYADGDSSYSISAIATDEDGTFSAGNTVAVTVDNVAPTLAISGASAVNEGALYTLNLSSLDPGADTISSWSINWGDSIEVVSGNPMSATHTYADGTSSSIYTISASATDEDGTVVAGNTVGVTVNNVEPTATIEGPGEGVPFQPLEFTFEASDPSTADQSSITFSVNWGDGTINSLESHEYTATGTYTISVIATDKDGGVSEPETHVVTINNTLDDNGTHFIGGSSSADSLHFGPANLAALPPGTQLVVIFAGGGNDDIQISLDITTTVWIFGGNGNDRLKGGGGHDVLVGGDGDDLLMGRDARDILIGGDGADRIIGNADEDILISGFVDFDSLIGDLTAIQAEWTSSHTYETRTEFIEDTYLIADVNVHDDDVKDTLTGDDGRDWLFANLDGDNTAQKDKITDLTVGEFAVDLDWINS